MLTKPKPKGKKEGCVFPARRRIRVPAAIQTERTVIEQ